MPTTIHPLSPASSLDSALGPPSSALSKRRFLLRLLALFAGGLLVLILAYAFRAPLLTAFARAWIIDEPPEKADAIVVLGGGVEYRPLAAAKLYQAGYAPKILIMDVSLSWTEQSGIKESERDVTRKILAHEGVPETAVEPVGCAVHNTSEESLAVRDWAKVHDARRLLITTEIFHTRRVKWLFRKRFRATEIDVRVVAAQPTEYASTNWWKVEQGLLAFQNEWVKLPYYWLKY